MKKFTFTLPAVFILTLLSQFLYAKNDSSALKLRVESVLGQYYLTPFEVSVKDTGVVTIRGTVTNFGDKLNVFYTVARVKGVREIKDYLDVQTDLVADNVIKDEIIEQLGRTRSIEDPSKVKVAVTNGLVILSGTVNLSREALVAEELASWWPGVKSIANDIQVLPPKVAVSDENLNSILKDMIVNFFPLEKKTVQVIVNNGNVTLNGQVSTLWARWELAKEVKHIRGVQTVTNSLRVVPEE